MVAVTILQGSAQLSKKWASNEASQNQGQKGLSLKISSLQNISIALKNYSITKSLSRRFQSIYYLPNLEFIWKNFEENKLKDSADVMLTSAPPRRMTPRAGAHHAATRGSSGTAPARAREVWRRCGGPPTRQPTRGGGGAARAPSRQHDAVRSVGLVAGAGRPAARFGLAWADSALVLDPVTV